MKTTRNQRTKFIDAHPRDEKTFLLGIEILNHLESIIKLFNKNEIRDVRVDNHLEAIYDIIIKKLIWK
jgi:hypothetical protein